MFIKSMVVGPLEANCYLVTDEETKEAIIIDPGAEGEKIRRLIEKGGLVPAYIVNTHGHIDHIGANGYLKEKLKDIKISIHPADAQMLINPLQNLASFAGEVNHSPQADLMLEDGYEINLGKLSLKVIHTPGHTPGGICLAIEGKVFTGDTLFAGSVGRTDLPGGSMDSLCRSIREKLLTLPDETIVYPGHGPLSTIGRERENNPFV
ncbi:MBL fold metallo-hydrolase [candidate division NPL-UPA2 bacterium]|nr:MBL fold metallo-hydrolase [candidate division NPL-UPA2 bacterium]